MSDTVKRATLEDAWAVIRELGEAQKETDRQLRQSNMELKKSLDKASGDFTSKWGIFLENLVEGDLVHLLNQRGVEVRSIHPGVKHLRSDKSVECEYDLIAVNGSEVVVFEVKTTLSTESLSSFLEKLRKFRSQFSSYSDKKIYGGMAYMKVHDGSDKVCMKEGLFLIKSPGGETNVSTLRNSKDFVPKSF